MAQIVGLNGRAVIGRGLGGSSVPGKRARVADWISEMDICLYFVLISLREIAVRAGCREGNSYRASFSRMLLAHSCRACGVPAIAGLCLHSQMSDDDRRLSEEAPSRAPYQSTCW